jgi:NTP pyrophosphatase (non-canonical NTP hydrolase)
LWENLRGFTLNLEKLPFLAEALHQRFGGREPFGIMTRLLEECGELAQEVNHFEGGETKLQKHGSPNKEKFAKEVLDVLRLVFQIVKYYELEQELEQKINTTYQRSINEGLISIGLQAQNTENLVTQLKSLPRDYRLKIVAGLENYSFYEKLGVPEDTDISQI